MIDLRSHETAWDSRAAVRLATIGSVLALLAALVAGVVAPGAARAAGPAALVVAALLGLPHGAVDHLAVGWARGRTDGPTVRFLAGYAFAAIAAATLAIADPAPCVLVLLLLSAAHFAEGESAFDRLRGGAGLHLPAAALGACVVAGPLLLRPTEARPILASLDAGLPGLLAPVRLPILLLLAALTLVGLVVALRAGSRASAAELVLVVVATLVGPALLVFAVWFAGWHATRHLVRLAALQPAGDGITRRTILMRGAAVPTALAAAGLAGLALVLGGVPSGVLVALLALTVPHAAVVSWVRKRSTSGAPPQPPWFGHG